MTGIGFKSGTHLAEEDADIIKILRELGAVLYVKTNQPQTIMHLETHSWHGRSVSTTGCFMLTPFSSTLTTEILRPVVLPVANRVS